MAKSSDFVARAHVKQLLRQAIRRNSFLGFLELQLIIPIRYSTNSLIYKWATRMAELLREV